MTVGNADLITEQPFCETVNAQQQVTERNAGDALAGVRQPVDPQTGETTDTELRASGPVADAASAVGYVFRCLAEGPIDCLVFTILSIVLGFSAFLLGVAGVLFNLVVIKTVFQFSLIIGNSPGLLIAWGILRDIGNMVILFGFIFIGVATILDIGGPSYAAKRTLPRLVLFAVLMNFSLFAAEAVIDTSNVFSAVMYRQATNAPCLSDALTPSGSAEEAIENTQNCANVGIAGSFMKASGLGGLFAVREMGMVNTSVYLMLSLFAVIGAVVLFAASIMLIIRAITLTFLMITSPIGFAGAAVPPFEKYAKDWWNKLIHQAFFAPLLLLMIFISLKIVENFAGTASGRGNTSLANALTQPNSSVMNVVLVFSLVIGFMIASIIAARKFGAMGADYAVKTAGNVVLGGTGFVGRNTMGYLSNKADRRIRSSRFGQTRLGRRVASVTGYGASATFDPRGIKGAGALKKQVGDLGKPTSGGYQGQVKRKTDKYTKYADTLEQTAEDKAIEEALRGKQREIDETKQKLEKRHEREDGRLAEDQKNAQDVLNTRRDGQKKAEKKRNQDMRIQENKLIAAFRNKDKAAQAAEQKNLEALQAEQERQVAEEERLIKEANDQVTSIKDRRETLKGRYNTFKNQLNRQRSAIEVQIVGDKDRDIVGVDKDSAKHRYVINLNNSRFPLSRESREKAYKKVKKELKKTKEDKFVDEIKDAIKSGNKEKAEKKAEELAEEVDKKDKSGS